MNNNLTNTSAAFVNLKGNEVINAYVKDIMRYKPLSAAEEKELFYAVELGNMASKELEGGNISDFARAEYVKMVNEGERAKNDIILRNQRFVYATAKRYAQTDDLLPDLISEGNIGLMTAFETYDVNSGNRFCTYAIWYIRRSINYYLTTGCEMIQKSNGSKTGSKIQRIQDKFFAEEGRFPTNEELCDILERDYNLKIKDKSDLFDLRVDSIDCGYDDEDEKAFENSKIFVSHSSVETEYSINGISDYNYEIFNYLMKYLDEREKMVIIMSFGLGDDRIDYSSAEIAEKMGVTAERVRQIKKDALRKMKAHKSEVYAL